MNKNNKAAIICLFNTLFLFIFLFVSSQKVLAERLAKKAYVDPKGFFRIVPPAGWKIKEYPQDPRGKVGFLFEDVSLRVLTTAVTYSSRDELIDVLQRIEKKLGFNTNIKKIEFFGQPAVQRSFSFRGLKFLSIDLLENKVDHNLQYAAPAAKFDRYYDLVMYSLETYEPVKMDLTEKDVIKHVVAKKLRLAQLMLEMGNREMAATYVREGLKLSPGHPGLLRLKKTIEAMK